MPKPMTIAQYAAHTGLADSTIRRRIKRGALPAHQVDGRWLINVDPQPPEQSPSHTPSHDPLIAQLQSENQHLREQVAKLTQVLAMQTHHTAELTKQLPLPREPLLNRLRSSFSRLAMPAKAQD